MISLGRDLSFSHLIAKVMTNLWVAVQHLARLTLSIFILCFYSAYSLASPWVTADDPFLRESIQLLSTSGYLETPVDTYPLLWRSILEDLDSLDIRTLNDEELFAYGRVRSAATFASQSRIVTVKFGANNFKQFNDYGFGNVLVGEPYLQLKTELKGDNWAMGISRQMSGNSNRSESIDSKWNESYISYHHSDLVFTLAQQSQWWGANTSFSSIFKSVNGPAKFIQVSNFPAPLSEVPILKYLGPMTWQVQFGELENAIIRESFNYSSMRLNARPHNDFSIGFSVFQTESIDPKEANEREKAIQSLLETHYSVDASWSLASNILLYGELNSQKFQLAASAIDGWLFGANVQFGTQKHSYSLHVELNKTQENVLDSENSEFENLRLPVPKGVSIGVSYNNIMGRGAYAKLLNLRLDDGDVWRSKLGYQEPIFGGIVTFEYSNNHFSDANSRNREEFGIGFEWRW